jgi:hypothetical protein
MGIRPIKKIDIFIILNSISNLDDNMWALKLLTQIDISCMLQESTISSFTIKQRYM